ncbi:TLR4 regulator and MIR-interacting MSAP-domain-containing protein [Haematococcus lacustris]|nr:hypothetical protein QJQ45_002287 [Haematococcus lacustris]
MVLRRTLVALLALTVAASKRIDAPCSACRAIAQELQERLDNEPVRNHLDMRHRLDAQGNRQGRVIDYRMSELRAVELLDNLCTRMKQWTLVKINTTNDAGEVTGRKRRWDKVSGASADSRPDKDEETALQKRLEGYCGRVLEDHDESIADALRQGTLEAAGASEWLCKGLLKACPTDSTAAAAPEAPGTGRGLHNSQERADMAAAAAAGVSGVHAGSTGEL